MDYTLHLMLTLQSMRVISKPILKKISKSESPHEIWEYLKETYYRDTVFSFIYQVASICLLSTHLDNDTPVANFMDKFDDQWHKVHRIAAGPTSGELYVYTHEFRVTESMGPPEISKEGLKHAEWERECECTASYFKKVRNENPRVIPGIRV